MGKEEKKSYVDRYIEKIEDLKELHEHSVVNITLRIDTYSDELLNAVTKKLGMKKSPFLCEPVEDFIRKAAIKAGVVDENGIIKKEYKVKK